jgi:hypothetical protein
VSVFAVLALERAVVMRAGPLFEGLRTRIDLATTLWTGRPLRTTMQKTIVSLDPKL